MAKWGQGDPRWIVEERPDAHNVNNWHWNEKDCTSWAKPEIKALFKGIKIEDEKVGSCYISKINSCDGEATLNNRKNRIICFYDFKITATWKGSLKGSDIVYVGELEIPSIADDTEEDDIDVQVSFTKDQESCYDLKEIVRKKAPKLFFEKLSVFTKKLKGECAQSLQVPTKEDTVEVNVTEKSKVANSFKEQSQPKPAVVSSAATPKIKTSCKELVMTVKFMTDVSELFKTLVECDRLSVWCRSKVTNNVKAGETFSLFDGSVTGKYLKVTKDSEISMNWRHKTWPVGHHSSAVLTLKQTSAGVELKLKQAGVPETFLESTKKGWNNYYWNPIKCRFGYGSDINGIM